MKKIVIFIIIIGVAFFFFFTRDDSSPAEQVETPAENENGSFRPDPSNAIFIFDDGPITLSAGRNERAVPTGSAFVEETVLLDKYAYGDINADGKTDTALFLVRFGAGSGTFIYLAAFVSGPVTYRGSKTIFIGDRISPQSISINNNSIVQVDYLDRGPDESFADVPTVPISKQFIYRGGEFQER